jgi:hypothetical protein
LVLKRLKKPDYLVGAPRSQIGSSGMHMGLEPSCRTVFGVAELAKEAVAVNIRIPSSALRVFVILLSLTSKIWDWNRFRKGPEIGIDFRAILLRMRGKYGTLVCRFVPVYTLFSGMDNTRNLRDFFPAAW